MTGRAVTGWVAAVGLLVLAVVVVLVVAACGSEGAGPPTPTTEPGGGSSTTAAESLVRYTRTGGVAGRRFEVVVRRDGTFEGGSGQPGRGHLGSDALVELRRLVDGFQAAKPESRYGEAKPDAFVSTVEAGSTTTTVLTGAEPPRPVQALIGFLAGLERQLPR